MNVEVYCDENHPDLLTSQSQNLPKFLLIGSLWLPAELRSELKNRIEQLRERFDVRGELKWGKISPSKLGFYTALIDLFMDQQNLRFRCIAVEASRVKMELHDDDGELGFYKFYYHMLIKWLEPADTHSIFCDHKLNANPQRMQHLKINLERTAPLHKIKFMQALPSDQVVLIQLADVLLGIASARLNHSLISSQAKEAVILHLEQRLGRRIASTAKTERKFNVFQILPNGGW